MLSQVVEHMPSKSQAPSWHEVTATKFASGKVNVICTCTWGRYNSPMTEKNACYHGKKALRTFGPHPPREVPLQQRQYPPPPAAVPHPEEREPVTRKILTPATSPQPAPRPQDDDDEDIPPFLTKILFGLATAAASIGIILALRRKII